MPISGLRVVTFNMLPIAHQISAGWAAPTGAILDHNNTSMVIAVGDGAVRVVATPIGEA